MCVFELVDRLFRATTYVSGAHGEHSSAVRSSGRRRFTDFKLPFATSTQRIHRPPLSNLQLTRLLLILLNSLRTVFPTSDHSQRRSGEHRRRRSFLCMTGIILKNIVCVYI